jgi:EAL domain-containing protein (putative c-di-GMP-specific phosphodiesterase class I)
MTLAEHAGAGTALSIWVLEETLRQCRAWQRQGVALRVAAQVHSLTLLEPQLPDLLTALLRHFAVPPEDLTLQFTEAALSARPDDALAGLDRLAGLGVRLSVTNYGTGQMSIDRLRRLPLHELGLDRSFLVDLERTTNVSLLSCMVQLGAALGLRVVVEGVETRSVFELMLGNGCTAFQGTYVSGPRSAENVEQWLRQCRSNGDSPSPRNAALPAGRAPGPASSG